MAAERRKKMTAPHRNLEEDCEKNFEKAEAHLVR
jgi:hypothetical protein